MTEKINLEQRAFSMITVKAVDEKGRRFSGIATTPTVDRGGDTINPLGVKFKNPLTLLSQHIHMLPIGWAEFGKVTKDGIPFEAEIPEIPVEDSATLKDRVDTAWAEIKHKLIRFVSIGFRPIKWAYLDNGGIDYEESECFELSPVSIPANAEAEISRIKSLTPEAIRLIKNYQVAQKPNFIPLIKAVPKQDFIKLK